MPVRATAAAVCGDGAPPPILPEAYSALVGRMLLYWWPDEGWQRSTVSVAPEVARAVPSWLPSPSLARGDLPYTRQISALRCIADTLLDAAFYGAR